MLTGKIFLDNFNELVGLIYTPSPNIDYYSYIKEQSDLGYHQVIITSQMMINLIEYLCIDRDFEVTKIELLEEDINQDDTISQYLNLTKKNKIYFHKLIEELKFIKDESSIDIKRVHFIGHSKDKKCFRFFIQVNGIYEIDKEFFEYETNELIKLLKRCMSNE